MNDQQMKQPPAQRSSRRIVIAVASLAIVTLVIALFLFRSPTPVQVSVAVNTTAIASAPILVAAENSLRTSDGIGIRIVQAPSGKYALDQLLAGSVDAATVAETPVVLNSITHPEIRIIMTIAESEYRIVARRGSGITQLVELRGKKIGTVQNASPHYFLSRMLNSVGIKEQEITLVPLQAPDLVTALTKGDVDAISIWEPQAATAIKELGDESISFENRSVYVERFNIVTTRQVLDDQVRRERLQRLLREVQHAVSHFPSTRTTVIALLARQIGHSETTIDSAWMRFGFPTTITDDLVNELQNVEVWAANIQKRSPRDRAQISSLIDDSLLTK